MLPLSIVLQYVLVYYWIRMKCARSKRSAKKIITERSKRLTKKKITKRSKRLAKKKITRYKEPNDDECTCEYQTGQ